MKPCYGDMDVVVLNNASKARNWLKELFSEAEEDDLPKGVIPAVDKINDLIDFEMLWEEYKLDDLYDYRIQ